MTTVRALALFWHPKNTKSKIKTNNKYQRLFLYDYKKGLNSNENSTKLKRLIENNINKNLK